MEREPGDSEQGGPARPSSQDPNDGGEGAAPARRFGASRVRPRVEFGAARSRPDIAADEASSLPPYEQPDETPFGSAFGAPREFANGRVRLYGCSPTWIIVSLVISVLLTCLLNAILNVF